MNPIASPDERRRSFDAMMGWPLCGHCGHLASAHLYGARCCDHVDCLGGRCTLYRPAEPIDPDSPAAFAEMVRGMAFHIFPRNRTDYDRDEVVGQITSVVSQLAGQWKGWTQTKPEGTE